MDVIKVKKTIKSKLSGGATIYYEKCAPSEEQLYTHVVVEKSDYIQIAAEYEKALKRVAELEDENQREQNFTVEIQEELDEARRDFETQLAAAQKMARQVQLAAEHQRNLNENLIRINKERANSKRGLTPKKEHTGYVLLSAEEHTYTHRYIDSGYNNETTVLLCWRVRLQTPYSAGLPLKNVTGLIYDDLLKTVGGLMGIKAVRDISKMTVKAIEDLWKTPDSFIFKTTHKLNGVKGFWEVEYLTSRIVAVPPEMFIRTAIKELIT